PARSSRGKLRTSAMPRRSRGARLSSSWIRSFRGRGAARDCGGREWASDRARMLACTPERPGPIHARPLSLRGVAEPTIGPTQALVRVRACGICRTDLHVVEGELAQRKSPIIPGHQVVGVVERVGADVIDVKVGERVGVAWLHWACGTCRFCTSARENLC